MAEIADSSTGAPLLTLRNIHRSFGPVRALRGVDLDVWSGEVHAIIGENGAGKSTLMKVLSGVYDPDNGSMALSGEAYCPSSPRDGRRAGISMIYQELTIAPHLTVAENVTLGIESNRGGWLRPRDKEVLDALRLLGQHDVDLRRPAGSLSIGKQQIIEIARAIVANAQIVVMDEPTSSLSGSDTRALFRVIEKLKDAGVAVVYISHFLEEVVEIGDRYTVLRDGETTATGLLDDISIDDLIPPMIGRSVSDLYPQASRTPGDVLLTVDEMSGTQNMPHEVSLHVRRGEILGIAGLVGAGRSETLRTLFGLHPGVTGTLSVGTNPPMKISAHDPSDALTAGLNLLSEDRKEEGLATGLSVSANLTLSTLARYATRGRLDLRREREQTLHWIDRLSIKCNSPTQPVSTLSGGNQQKVCLARLLHDDSDVLLLDEPTRGIDIGSKAEMYRLIAQAAASGKAIILTSSYLPELFGICDRLAVMYRGKLSEVRQTTEWTDQSVLRYATSGKTD